MSRVVDLRSDTVTKPTQEMREAMMNAVVGDACYGEDPTVNALEKLAAEKTGKEAAMYVPTGTMGNTAAMMTHVQRGDIVIMEPECHIYYYEMGNVSSLASALPVLVGGEGGCLDPELVESALQNRRHRPRTALICMENTHNRAGGRVVPLVAHLMKDRGLSSAEIQELKRLVRRAERESRSTQRKRGE